MNRHRLTKAQETSAITAYARKYGYYVRTIRVCTELRAKACGEYRAKHSVSRETPKLEDVR